MADLTLYINQDAPNRSVCLVNRTGSGATPILSLPLVFADIYTTNVQFVDKNGATGSYYRLSGSTATLALGNVGEPALAIASASFQTSSSYYSLFGLNTTELSQSLSGTGRSRQYTLELQVVSGSSVFTFQSPCVVSKDIVQNAIYPINVNYIVSASYANRADTASYVKVGSGVFYTQIDSGSGVDASNVNIKGKLTFNGITDVVVGTATLVGGTASVSTPSISSSPITHLVFLTGQTTSSNAGELSVGNRVNGVSFAITSSNASDNRKVAWFIVENIV